MDGFELRNDGTAVFQFDEKTNIELRRPTLGEYRLIVEGIERMREAVNAATDEKTEEEEKDGLLSNQKIEALHEALIEWFTLVFKTLGSGELPDEDSLPAWLLNGELTGQLIAHWQKVPSRRGVR